MATTPPESCARPTPAASTTSKLAREPVDKTISRGVRLARKHRPHAIGVETTAFQAVLANEWNRQALPAGIDLLVMGIANTDNKLLRIRRLGPGLAPRRTRFYAGSWGAREVVNQLRDFPIGDHDDGPDALEMAFRLLDDLVQGSNDNGSGQTTAAPVAVGRPLTSHQGSS